MLKELFNLPNSVNDLMRSVQGLNDKLDYGTTADFIRHKLGSIDLEDVRDTIMTEQEQQEYNAAISVSFSFIQKTIKKFIINQEQFMGRQAKDVNQLDFGRGTINGLLLLLEEFESADKNHKIANTPKEKPDQSTYFPNVAGGLGGQSILVDIGTWNKRST